MIVKILKLWIPLAFVTTVLCGIVYLAVQQNYRQNANDPQLRIAQDMGYLINNGNDPRGFDLKDFGFPETLPNIDIPKSTNTFVIIFNSEGNIIMSNLDVTKMGSLQDVKLFNEGMFEYSKIHGENRVTWEPKQDLRLATVIVPYSFPNPSAYKEFSGSGYILVARNLKEVENRIGLLTIQVGAGWIVSTLGSFILIAVLEYCFSKRKHN